MDELNAQDSETGIAPKRRNILLFSDGTGNSSSKLQKTNVWRLYEAADLGYPVSKAAMKSIIERKGENAPDAHSDVQIAYYDNGVGTSSFKLLAVLGGIFGFGLARNIRDLYKFLCRNYSHGDGGENGRDRIYAFGFSRGAYTIRLLVSLIATMGVVDYKGITESELDMRVRDMWRAYRRCFRTNNELTDLLVSIGRAFWQGLIWCKRWVLRQRRDFPVHPNCHANWLLDWYSYWNLPRDLRHKPSGEGRSGMECFYPPIEFVGVWDTVAAYGGPIVEITRAIDEWIWPLTMPNYELSKKVRRARHALSIDDKRDSFHPLLWDETYENDLDAPQPRLQQVWFAGMHSDVGGGYSDESLSYVSLFWMIEHAEDAGLRLLPEFRERIDVFRNVYGPIHNSRGGGGAFYRYQPRYISAWLDYEPRREFRNPQTGESVLAHVRPGTQIFRDPTIDRGRYSQRGLLRAPIRLHKSVEERLDMATDGYSPNNIPPNYIVDKGVDGCEPAKHAAYWDVASEQALKDGLLALGDRIKMRRFWYFASIFVLLLIVLKPVWPSIPVLKEMGGTIDARTNAHLLESTANAFLPQFAERWTSAISADPYVSAVIIGLFFLTTALGVGQEMKMSDIARQMWRGRFAGSMPAIPGPGPILGIARLVHTSDELQGGLAFLKWRLTPLVVGFALWSSLVYAGLAIFTQLWLVWAEPHSACGKAGQEVGPGSPVLVDIRSPCTALGYPAVERKTTYRIEIETQKPDGQQGDWFDESQPANPEGWTDDSWRPYLFEGSTKAFRRVTGAPLFAPVIEMRSPRGNRFAQWLLGDDIHMIVPELHRRQRPGVERTWEWEGTFTTPDRVGPLYFFVNDAVIPFDPAGSKRCIHLAAGVPLLNLCGRYGNNSGIAKVTIERAEFAGSN